MKLIKIKRLNLAVILFLSISVSAICATEKPELPILLTPAKAEQIVKERRERSEALEETKRKIALETVALDERVIRREDGQELVLRRVAAAKKVLPDPTEAIASDEHAQGLPFSELVAEQKLQYESISLRANVYGDEYSEITWRDNDTKQAVTVWTNISLNHLRPIVSVSDELFQYSYFGFVTSYTREGEERWIEMAEKYGYKGESRWKYPPVRLSSDYYEYFVDAPSDADIPEKLYRQLDALLGFYLTNEESLEIEHLNSAMLSNAHRKDLAENPRVKPERVIMNYTPLRGKDAE
jgi:hypothetical protein